jgi:hypothetical protein
MKKAWAYNSVIHAPTHHGFAFATNLGMSILCRSIPKNLCDVMKLMVVFFIEKKVYGKFFEDTTSGDNFRISSKRYHSSDSRGGGSARS